MQSAFAGAVSVAESSDRKHSTNAWGEHESDTCGPLLKSSQWDDSNQPLYWSEPSMADSRSERPHGTDT